MRKKGRFSVSKWPFVALSAPKSPPRTPQGHPKGGPRGSKMEGKSFQNVISYKNVKTSKMTTIPRESHIFKRSKGPKIDRKASPNDAF